MRIVFLTLTAVILLSECKKDANAQSALFAKGADIGWLSEMESAGIRFRNAQGQEEAFDETGKPTAALDAFRDV